MPANTVFDTAYVEAAVNKALAAIEAATTQRNWDIALCLAQVALQRFASNSANAIAEWQLAIAEDYQRQWEKFLPYERQLAIDVFNIPKYLAQYLSLALQYDDIMEDSFYANHDDLLDWLEKKCAETNPCADGRWLNEMALARADMMSYAARVEEQREQALNDRRYAWQYAVLMLGKNTVGSIAGFAQLAGDAVGTTNDMMQGLIRFGVHALTYTPPQANVPWTPQANVSTAGYNVGVRQMYMEPPNTGRIDNVELPAHSGADIRFEPFKFDFAAGKQQRTRSDEVRSEENNDRNQ